MVAQEFIKTSTEAQIEFVKRSGIRLVTAESGFVKCLMPSQGNEDQVGSMYAGALFTLAEIPGGVMWLTTFDVAATMPILKSMNIDFLGMAKGDISVEVSLSSIDIARVKRECLESGKSDMVLNAELKDMQGVLVARSRSVYQIRNK